ncbi:MAG: type 4a pilus biogenesis protein PilO [Candidatus Omnitrophica bacterium]|jgi:Tfp pilus assembly protein PilO|nr:type 4a pilus biogenesis protein PilO [Candidatus Omnitrophota bacterium]
MISIEDIIKKYQSQALNLIVVFLALIIAFKIYEKSAAEVAILNQTKNTQIEKNIALEKISKINQEIGAVKKFINQKDLDSVINTIGDIAQATGVDILSINPAADERNPYYTKFFFDLVLSADSYHKIGKFISLLESSQDIFNIEAVNLDQQSNDLEADNRKEIKKISVNLKLSKILAK